MSKIPTKTMKCSGCGKKTKFNIPKLKKILCKDCMVRNCPNKENHYMIPGGLFGSFMYERCMLCGL